MKVRVEDITEKGVVLSAEEPVEDYPSLQALGTSGECEITSPVKIEITALREYDHIRVDGHVSTIARLRCSRCLAEYYAGLAASFTLFYDKTTGVPLEEEAELKEQDLVSIAYDGEYIDFTNEIAEQILMEIPYKPLCKEECKGICSQCGTDLNAGECSCRREGASLHFAVLKDFKVKK